MAMCPDEDHPEAEDSRCDERWIFEDQGGEDRTDGKRGEPPPLGSRPSIRFLLI